MAVELIIAPEAEEDLAEAYACTRIVELGWERSSCVDACIEAIRRMPDIHAIIYEDYRRGLVRRFLYAVFYEHAKDRVAVYGVFHTSRDPDKWRQRFP